MMTWLLPSYPSRRRQSYIKVSQLISNITSECVVPPAHAQWLPKDRSWPSWFVPSTTPLCSSSNARHKMEWHLCMATSPLNNMWSFSFPSNFDTENRISGINPSTSGRAGLNPFHINTAHQHQTNIPCRVLCSFVWPFLLPHRYLTVTIN